MKLKTVSFLAFWLWATVTATGVVAAEQAISLWQLNPAQPAMQQLHTPAHSAQHIALSLDAKQLSTVNAKTTVAIAVPLFHQPLQLNVNRVTVRDKQRTLHASNGSQRLILTTDGSHTFATVITERGSWSINGKDNSAVMYQSHDPAHLHSSSEKDYIIAPPQQPVLKKSPPQQQSADVDSDTVAIVDAYILYNDAAAQLYGSNSGALTRINHIVAVTNDIYRASNVKIELNALRIDKVDYPQSFNTTEALYHVTGNNDQSYFTEQRQIRDAIGADVMILLRPYVNDGICGQAWANSSFYSTYYMVSHTSINCGDEVNAHELGHNMGLLHSRKQGDTGATYPFALGHGVDNSFTTVMAYPSAFGGASRVFKFSSPDLDCNGLPCGVDRNDSVNGADAVYALNQKRFEIAAVAERGLVHGSLNVAVSGATSAAIVSSSGHGGTAPYGLSQLELGSTVSLSAPASADGIAFFAWRGCDSSNGLDCSLTLRGHSDVTAIYADMPASLAEAADAPELEFISGGGAEWQIDALQNVQGPASVRSGAITDYQQSIMETSISGDGSFSFSWKVSSENYFDYLRFYVNNQIHSEISGEVDWQQITLTLPAGNNQLRWAYSKDGSVSSGLDAGWVDNVSWQPNPAPANDSFAQASLLSGIEGQIDGNNQRASAEQGEPVIAGASGKTLWWRWTAPFSGPVYINTHNSSFNTVLAVYTGDSFTRLEQVAFNDDSFTSLSSELNFNAVAGTEYSILVDGMFGAAGDIRLYWFLTPQVELSLSRAGEGAGTVQLNAYAPCTDSCNYTLSLGQHISVSALADSSSEFSHWSGACSGSGSCEFILEDNSSVSAHFALKQYDINISSGDGGTVISAPGVVNHGQGAVFTLQPAKGYRVNRQVSGTCPAGQWLDSVTYQTGPASGACSVSFSFSKIVPRKFPLWLLAIPKDDSN